MSSVRNRIVTGAIWLTSLKLMERGIGFISTLILARLLVPEDFGLVAMGMSIVLAMDVFTSFGFDTVLIQKQRADASHYHTSYTFQVCFGLIGGIAIAALAHPASDFYKDPRLVAVMFVIAVNFFLSSLENIWVVDFRKQLDFGKEVFYRLAIKLIGFAAAVPAAFILRSYWALLIGVFATNAAKLILSYVLKPVVPRFTFSRSREIFLFSGWLMINNALFLLRARAHDFFIGRLLGARSLGLFSISHEISTLIPSEIVAPVNRAVFPGYAQMSGDAVKLRDTYLDVMACIMLVALPAATGVAAVADLLIPLLLGPSWTDSVPLIKVLSIFGALFALTSNSVYVFHALALPQRVTRLAVYEICCLLPALYFMTREYGLIGSAYALLLTVTVVSVPWMWVNVSKILNTSVARLLERVWRPTIASAFMYGLLQWFFEFADPDGELQQAVCIALGVLIGVLAYGTVIAGTWWLARMPSGGERILFRLIQERVLVHLHSRSI